MNASPHHPKVKVSCKLSDPLYVAGGFVAGKMEVECRTDKGLGLGVMMAELSAIEGQPCFQALRFYSFALIVHLPNFATSVFDGFLPELTSRDHSATSTFYHARRLFQGPGLPPSNSVHAHPPAGAPPLSPNYYYARKGMTTFLFRFPLPPSCPSSINFGSGLATIRYEVRVTVGVAYKGENKLVFDKKEVDIVEAFEPDFSRVDPEAMMVGESGKIWLQAKLLGGVVVANQPACVELTVKNHSLKKVNARFLSATPFGLTFVSRTRALIFRYRGTSIFPAFLRHRRRHFRYRTPLSPSRSKVPIILFILAQRVWQTSFLMPLRIREVLRAVRGLEMRIPRNS